MFLVGLSMLSLVVCLFLKMIDYCSSYAENKFDVDLCLCSIHGYGYVLMKINAGFLLLVVRWSCLCIQLNFLEKIVEHDLGWWWTVVKPYFQTQNSCCCSCLAVEHFLLAWTYRCMARHPIRACHLLKWNGAFHLREPLITIMPPVVY